MIGSQRLLSKTVVSDLPQLSLNGTVIPYSSSVKDLGFLIDQNLSWQPQVNEVGRRIVSRIHSLKRLQQFIAIATDRKSTRLNSSHTDISRMPSSA